MEAHSDEKTKVYAREKKNIIKTQKRLWKLGHYQKERGLETQFWLLAHIFDFEKLRADRDPRTTYYHDNEQLVDETAKGTLKLAELYRFDYQICAKCRLHCQGRWLHSAWQIRASKQIRYFDSFAWN